LLRFKEKNTIVYQDNTNDDNVNLQEVMENNVTRHVVQY